MLHGMSSDMMEWVFNTADRANAFTLARAGYDVWMGNNRGSEFSYGHTTLTKKDKAYWDFYQADLGTKDVPSFIDYILDATTLETLSYVGHSQGTTQFLLGASLMPTYFTEKINVALLLAPVGRPTNIDVEAF